MDCGEAAGFGYDLSIDLSYCFVAAVFEEGVLVIEFGESSCQGQLMPVTRGRTGSKLHLITDATGIPLAAILTGGNNDVTQLIPLLEAVPPVRGNPAGPGAARTSCLVTVATTTTSTADSFRPLG